MSHFYNEDVKESVTNASRFESNSNKIKWIQKGGALVYEFDINSISNGWDDVSKDGEVIVDVSFRGNKGSIKFSRKQGQTSIETDIRIDGKNILPFTFTINAISEL